MIRYILTLFVLSLGVWAQTVNAINGNCSKGGQNILLFNTPSTGTQPIGGGNKSSGSGIIGSYPSCTVQVFFTGTLTQATLYANTTLKSMLNPFTANVDGSWTFFVPVGQGYDIFMSGGGMPSTVALTDVFPGTPLGGCSGAGCSVPVGLPNGYALVSNGSSNPPIYRLKQAIDVRDYGVVGDGSTDDTVAMQNAINGACPSATHFSGALFLGPTPFIVKVSGNPALTISKCWGIVIDCPSSQGQATPAIAGNCGFYNTTAGATTLEINQTRDSEFKNFFIDCNNCNVPLLIDEIGSVTTITTNLHFQDIAIRNDVKNANFVGVNICPTAPGNCEAINFDRLNVTCSSGTPGVSDSGTGLQYVGGEPFYEYVHGFFPSGCSVGAVVFAGNIIDFDGGLAAGNYTDFWVDGGRNIDYRHFRSENGIAQIVLGTAVTFPGHDVTIQENSFSGLTNNTTTISYSAPNTGGSFQIIKNEWDSNSTITPFGPAPSSSGVFVGHLFTSFNNYPNSTNCPPVSGSNHVAEYVSILDDAQGMPACTGGIALGGYFNSPQIVSTILSGTAPFSVVSPTPVTTLEVSAHPLTYEAGAFTNGEKIYTNTQALTGGSATHTFAGSFSFTSSSTFGCTCTDRTAANACQAVPASASTVTLAGTGNDVLWISCTGH